MAMRMRIDGVRYEWGGGGHRAVRIKPAAEESHAERLREPEMTLQMMKTVDLVQRNFWTFVADELERATGELFNVQTLEERFREL